MIQGRTGSSFSENKECGSRDSDIHSSRDSAQSESSFSSSRWTDNKQRRRNRKRRKKRTKDITVAATSASNPAHVIVKGRIFNRSVNCFLDTGSAVNLISLKLVEESGQTTRIEPTSLRLKSITGDNLPTMGELYTQFDMGGHISRQTFIVCPGMDNQILLGDPFFRGTGSVISYGSKTISCGRNTNPVPFSLPTPNIKTACAIHWESSSAIPANSVAYLAGSIPGTIPHCVGLIDPISSQAFQGLMVASAVSEAAEGRVIIKVVNISDDPVEVTRGGKVGQLTPIPNYQPIQGVCIVKEADPDSTHIKVPATPEEWTEEELFRRLKIEEIETEMTEEQRSRLKDILWANRSIFSKNEYDIGCANFYQADIRLKHNAEPCWVNPIPVPYKLRGEMDRNIEEMQRAGVIEELESPSDWNSPIFLVKKKTAGQYRLVCDLRKVNQECIGDSYPLPNLNHVLDSIGQDTLFTSLDLSKGFWQVAYTEESKKVTAFLHRGKQYCFARMIMGHRASSAKFTRMMNKLLDTLPIEQVIYFIDDVFLSAANVEQHLDRVERLFERFRSANLKISPDKTNLLKRKVEFVGISVGENGISITEDRVRDLLAMRSPSSRKEVMEILGAFNYIRKWVPNYSAVSKPLHASLKGGKFHWTPACEEAYAELKRRVATSTTLAVPDPEDPFNSYEVTVDASIHGLGATLSQELETNGVRERRIVAFFSKGIPEYKRSRGQTRLEFEAMVAAIEHWRVYLANTPFVVVTDCKSLLAAEDSLFAKSDAVLIRKTTLLANYDFKIRHIDGKSNTVADFLSRFPHLKRKTTVATQTDTTGTRQTQEETILPLKTPDTPDTPDFKIRAIVSFDPDGPRVSSEEVYTPGNPDTEEITELQGESCTQEITDVVGAVERKEDGARSIERNATYVGNVEDQTPLIECPETKNTTQEETPEVLDSVELGFEWLDSCDSGEVRTVRHRAAPNCRCDLPLQPPLQVSSLTTTDPTNTTDPAYSSSLNTPLHTNEEWAIIQRKDDILQTVIKWKEDECRPPLQANRAPRELHSLWRQFDCLRVHNQVLERKWIENSTEEERWLTVVPPQLREQVMWRTHCVISGHGGTKPTLECARRAYYWYKMEEDISLFVQACPVCTENKQPRAYGRAAMKAEIYHQFNDAIVLDHIVPKASSHTRRGHSAILTITDAYSNFLMALPVKTQTAEENKNTILNRWVALFGLPREIISDNHQGFKGEQYRKFFEHLGVKMKYGHPYSAKTTARAESSNKRVNQVLRATLHQMDPQDWDLHLPQVCFTLNSLKNRRTGFTPYRLVFGREANISETLLKEDGVREATNTTPQRVYEHSKELRILASKVRKNAARDIAYAAREYNKALYEPSYKEGEQVYIHIACPTHKFAARWRGPFLVSKVISPYLYMVRISSQEEKVFNISKLKKSTKRSPLPGLPPPRQLPRLPDNRPPQSRGDQGIYAGRLRGRA